MKQALFSLVALVAVTLFTNPAYAAVSDCASQGCVAVCNGNNVEMYFDDGTSAGTITGVGSGECTISADEGYLVISRTSGDTYIYDVENGTTCWFGYAGNHAIVFGSHVYVTDGVNGRIAKVGLDCTGYTEISVPGTYPFEITKDSTTIYVINSQTANVTTIVPPSTTPVYNDIGRVFGDQLQTIKYHAGNNKLYVGGLAGIYEVSLPLDGTSTLWQTLPSQSGEMSLTNTHIGIKSGVGNSAYLIPFSSPSSYSTMGCVSCRSVALNDSTFYSMGGTSPDLNVRAWDMSGAQYGYSPLAGGWSTAWLAPTITPPVCGDNVKNGTDECDGADFGTATCQSLGFDGGTLSCSGSCTIDTSACFYNCGNGAIDAGEDCDGANLNGTACTDLGFDSGSLSCSASCEFDTTSCVTLTCGNGQLDNGEDCDGSNLGGETCQSLGFDGGPLSCSSSSCTFDTSGCVTDLCGNSQLDAGEDCDGANLGGETCQSQGFDGGSLSCTSSCTLNTDACTLNTCGNGLIDNGEQCDDGNTAAGDGCSGNCQVEEGYSCEGEPSNCTLQDTCNQDGLVTVLDSIDDPKLKGAALERYQETSALPKGSTVTCETSFGENVIKVEVPVGHHENVRVVTPDSDVIWHLYDGAVMYVNTAPPYNFYVTSGGSIALHSGSDIDVKYESLGLGTLGTVWMARFHSLHPITKVVGNWLEIQVTDSRIRLFSLEDSSNSVVLAAPEMDEPIYINLDALGDLSDISKPNLPPTGGCNGCNSSNGTPPHSFMFLLIMFWILMPLFRKRG